MKPRAVAGCERDGRRDLRLRGGVDVRERLRRQADAADADGEGGAGGADVLIIEPEWMRAGGERDRATVGAELEGRNGDLIVDEEAGGVARLGAKRVGVGAADVEGALMTRAPLPDF